jgi:hypothetical protein
MMFEPRDWGAMRAFEMIWVIAKEFMGVCVDFDIYFYV